MGEAIEVLRELGLGGSSDVLLARRRGPYGFSRLVVLKRLKACHATNLAYLADFTREARAYALLNHPSIVQLYDFIQHEGQPALVLEYVNGLSLHSLRTRLNERRETLGDEDAFYVMHDVFAALAAAHAARDPETGEFAGVVHRDVSPSNVLVSRDGSIKLTDFGIAKVAGADVDTAIGLVKGTYPYMAPEQLLGGPVSSRTDVYSASLLLRELLLRKPTFVRGSAPEPEYLETIAHPSLPPIEALRTGVPRAVCLALKTALQPSADARDITAADIREILAKHIDRGQARDHLAALITDVRPPAEPVDSAIQCATTRPRDSAMRQSFETPLPLAASASVPTLRRTKAPPRPERGISVGVLGHLARTASAIDGLGSRGFGFRSAIGAFAVLAAFALSPLFRETSVSSRTLARATLFPQPPGPAHEIEATLRAAPASARFSPEAAPTAAAETPPPTVGDIVATPTPACLHRVFIDGKTAGVTGATMRVTCGPHTARVGSKGRLQSIQVPCGGTVTLDPRW